MFFLMFIISAFALLVIALRANGVKFKIHNPPPEEQAKIDAAEAEARKKRAAAIRRPKQRTMWDDLDDEELPTDWEYLDASDPWSRLVTPLVWRHDD